MKCLKILILLFFCIGLFFNSIGHAAEKIPLSQKQEIPTKPIQKTAPKKISTQKRLLPYIEIKTISLDRNNHIVIALENTGQAALSKKEYLMGKIFVQEGTVQKKQFFTLAKIDPRFLIKNPGHSYTWTTEIECKKKTQVSVGVQSVNGERKQTQFLRPMFNKIAVTQAKVKKKHKSDHRIIISDFSFDGQVYPGEEIRFLCQMPVMAESGTVNFSLYRGSQLVGTFSQPYQPLSGSTSIRPLYHLSGSLRPGNYHITAEMDGFSGTSSSFSILDTEVAAGRHVIVHIEQDGSEASTVFAGSRIFVWYDIATPLPENIRISLRTLRSGRVLSTRLLYEGEARPGRGAGVYFDLPGDISNATADISINSWGAADNHKMGKQSFSIVPRPGENGVVILIPEVARLSRTNDITVVWLYTNSESEGPDRYSIALISSTGAVTPMGSGLSVPSETETHDYVISAPEHIPEGRYKIRIRYENGLTGISTDYFTLVDEGE